ncbi:MAG: acetyl-CoA carboxylase carboxyl transferase subunit alpha/beta, partial [Desulfobulbaceae bacterium]|nr:acetyl-CoA carboxylase carboxyl transferase subunit alpha/beta [Desulfobulbaceae bacterium]
MEDINKRLLKVEDRISYIAQVKEGIEWGNLAGLQEKTSKIREDFYDYSEADLVDAIRGLEDAVQFLEERCEENLSPMERVRIVRSPLRFSLQDLLENVYEDYTELG